MTAAPFRIRRLDIPPPLKRWRVETRDEGGPWLFLLRFATWQDAVDYVMDLHKGYQP